jgi:acetate kinase
VGSYYVTLRGNIDALVFAGGIGEKSARLRAAVADQLACLGFQLDAAANEGNGQNQNQSQKSGGEGEGEGGDGGVVWDVGKPGVVPRLLVCQTDEQFEMARMCAEEEQFWS